MISLNEKQYTELTENLKDTINNPDFKATYQKMHTPWHRRYKKVRPNDICPFCASGKKFKKCKCFKKYNNTPIYSVNYEDNKS